MLPISCSISTVQLIYLSVSFLPLVSNTRMIDQACLDRDPDLRQYLAVLRRKHLEQSTSPNEEDKMPEHSPEQEKFSVEMIFRKAFKETLREYTRNCSLAGVQKMCDPHIGIWERLIRIAVFLAAIGMSCYFLLYIWSNTLTNPLIVTMQTNTYPISEIDFPAVALCNVNRISKKALKKLAKEEYRDLAKKNEPIEEVEAMLLQWGRLLDLSYNDSLRKNPIYVNLLEKYVSDTQRVKRIMKRLAPSCDDQLLRCIWAGKVVECQSIFSMRKTSLGDCCIFNFNREYFVSGKVLRGNEGVKRQVEAGRSFGMTVILDSMSDDRAYSLSKTLGYDIFIFHGMNFGDPRTGRVIHRKAEPNMALFLQLQSYKQIAAPEVRKYSVKTRNCLFRDEMSDIYNNMYSYSTCIVNCRVSAIQSLCKCTPYFAADDTERNVCSLDNLRCLNKYKDKLNYLYPVGVKDPTGLEMEIQNSLFCEDCYPDCELTTYSTKSYSTPIVNAYKVKKNFQNKVLNSINTTDKVLINVYHPNQDATLDRLDVVNYWYEIMSSVGGFGSIVIGFSIISVVEIFYFFTIRFSHHFRHNYLEYH